MAGVDRELGNRPPRRIADLAREQNRTTVADFVSARHGKSRTVAALAASTASSSTRTTTAGRGTN
jgi:hypothetical protein